MKRLEINKKSPALTHLISSQTSGLVDRVFPPLGDSKFFAGIMAGMVEEFALSSGKLDNVRVWFNNKVCYSTLVS